MPSSVQRALPISSHLTRTAPDYGRAGTMGPARVGKSDFCTFPRAPAHGIELHGADTLTRQHHRWCCETSGRRPVHSRRVENIFVLGMNRIDSEYYNDETKPKADDNHIMSKEKSHSCS